MTDIFYGVGAYKRNNGNMPEMVLKNMFLEQSPTSETGTILLSREGLATYSNIGSGPIRGLFCHENVFDGEVFCVSGNTLYRGVNVVGPIAGNGPVSFAAGSSTELVINAGTLIYRYNGVTPLDIISFPDDQDVSHVVFHDGLYIAIVAGTDKWFWSDVLDADTWEPLNFASAEASPDVLRDIRISGDFLYLIGAETIEKWANTGDADIPYSRIEGSILKRGALTSECTVDIDDTIVLVGNDGIVYVLSNELNRVSDHAIEEKITTSTIVKAFGFIYQGHPFYCLRLDTGTFLFDLVTNQWCEFSSYGRSNWQAQCACVSNLQPLFGDDTSGTIWSFGNYSDNSNPLERIFTAVFPIKGGIVIVDNLNVEANTGWTELLAGQGSNPKVEMRSSRDAGATWSDWQQTDLGQQGRYRTRTRWRRCGMFDVPGGMFQIRITDPVPFRVSSVSINDEGGGRSR